MITLHWNTGYRNGIPETEVEERFRTLLRRDGAGNDFLGWMDPESIAPEDLISEIVAEAERLRRLAKVVVVAGIGGSYLGARAVIEALSPAYPAEDQVRIAYAGNSLSEDDMHDLLELLDRTDYAVIVISKSGTTTETAVSFRLLQAHCERKYGAQAVERIVCITDKEKGALKKLAVRKGYPCYILPDDVGGRYSVLTPVGLLPIAVAGFDIRALVHGAAAMKGEILEQGVAHDAVRYACHRNTLYRQGTAIEVLASFEPRLHYIIEWWKQLYGESEGKEQKGLFPAGVVYTTDLHSMGQFMQDGSRLMMESFLTVASPQNSCAVPLLPEEENLDQLNYLAGRRLHEINRQAYLGTALAHEDGGVPSLTIELERLDAENLGRLLYFFEFASAISGYLLGVNPFDQPGVEAYKRNMFALLGKKGYEQEGVALRERLEQKKA
ncbi:MAG: glucose-6-phosphate isomerase [Bacteroidales bacterium]|nr:glucose-6-phosphate isomerase [Bacteroidales bacterium]